MNRQVDEALRGVRFAFWLRGARPWGPGLNDCGAVNSIILSAECTQKGQRNRACYWVSALEDGSAPPLVLARD